MPTLVWRYRTALLSDRPSGSCMMLADALEPVSHDRLTRRLPADWSGQTLLELAVRPWFVWERGDLITDDRGIPKPFATAIESLAWGYSSQEHKPVSGLSLVWLIWTNGTVRIPLGMRLWHKGGPSQYALALAWFSSARNRLRCHPAYVLFDAWYPSKPLVKRIRDYGGSCVGRLKKNRRFHGRPLRASRRHPYWAVTGRLTGGGKVLVVRYGAKYVATHRLRLPAAAVRRLYRVRAHMEEVIWVCKNQRSLSGCQACSERAQQHHIRCCLAAFGVLAHESHARGIRIYQLKRCPSFRGHAVILAALEQLRSTA